MYFEKSGQWLVASGQRKVRIHRPSVMLTGHGPRVTGHLSGAFSLIELTVVLALLALLAGIVTVSVRHHLIKGKQNAAKSEIAVIRTALETFYASMGRYPGNEEGLVVLTTKSDELPEKLLSHLPVDPWGRPYQYNQPGRDAEPYEILCLGADGREGGEGADADIASFAAAAAETKGVP